MILAEKAHLEIASGSHPGMRGKNNEDMYAVSAYSLNSTNPIPVVFAIVADGIGGHNAGEVAAEIAVKQVMEDIAESDASQPTEILQAAIQKASEIILSQGEENKDKEGMGTTVVCAWVIQNHLYIASVGNSRIYLLRNKKLNQINKDHSWVQEAIDAGVLDRDRARTHPYSNVIRRYLGSPISVDVDLRLWLNTWDSDAQASKNQGAELKPRDRLLVCTDGLNDMVSDDKIQEIMNSEDIDQATHKLIEQANQNGGKDNITVVILEMP